MTDPTTNQQRLDWPFLIPILLLVSGGTAGLVWGSVRDARLETKAAAKRAELGSRLMAQPRPSTDYSVPYNLEEPDWLQVLPVELNEISGFAVDQDGEGGWAVNDEAGQLYPFALAEGLLGAPFEFAGRGDYEGVEIVGDEVVVARSDGTLYRVRQDETVEIESMLDFDYDVEGLALDRARSRLLVACKGVAGVGKAFNERKAIYSLKLPEFTWNKDPAYTIAFSDLKQFIKKHDVQDLKGKQAEKFEPSAIAVTPDDRHIYILSSVGRMLVVLDVQGNIVAVQALPRQPHRQPEGLAFDGQESLYVSNEGRGRSATLYRFDPIPQEDTGRDGEGPEGPDGS